MSNPASKSQFSVVAEGLTKAFPVQSGFLRRGRSASRMAVDNIDMRLREGEIFGLVGPNGAGKTTLIKLLTTLLRPDSGSARVAGLDVMRDEFQVRRIVGLVTSNERSFYWRLTGRQNLEFFASLYEIPTREARAWIDELFDLLDLADKADARFDSYSTGMKQRLAVARGLLSKPRIIFMDEPTKGVDPVSRADLIQVIQERIIERWNPTLLITSHNLNEIEVLCGRIALMAQGRFIAVGSLTELRTLTRSAEHFELRIANVSEERLRALAGETRVCDELAVVQRNGAAEVSIQFRPETEGLARFVRSVVEGGGEVLHCTSVVESFDEVFQNLVAQDTASRASSEQEAGGAP